MRLIDQTTAPLTSRLVPDLAETVALISFGAYPGLNSYGDSTGAKAGGTEAQWVETATAARPSAEPRVGSLRAAAFGFPPWLAYPPPASTPGLEMHEFFRRVFFEN